MKRSDSRKRVMSNSVYLFILTFSNFFLYFLTIPYQARVLGPEIFGLVGFAMALTAYFKIVIDFGFMISATEQISIHRDDRGKVSKILSDTMYAKSLLLIVSAVVLLLLCMIVPVMREHMLLFILFFIGSAAKSLLPDFVYRGIERMRTITIRTVAIQLFFLVFLFVFVKSPEDVLWIPALDAIGSVVALLFAAGHINKSLGFSLKRTEVKDVLKVIRESLWFFYSRIAANIYTATNIFVLGAVYGAASHIVGLYVSADRLVSAGKQVVTPIGDSLYPYMVRRNDYRLLKLVLIAGTLVMAAGCIIVAIYANDVTVFIFGQAYYGAGDYLRILTIVVFFAFPGILLGFPTLSPMGLAKHANISNIIAACLQIIQLLALLVFGNLTVINICIVTCITEFSTVAYRAVIIWKYRDRMKNT